MPEEKLAISIGKLTKRFGKLSAVDGIDLKVGEGEVFALLGPNGAGKTTTISMLTGLLAPTSGTATVAGFDVKKEPLKVRQAIGVVFQQPSVDDLLSGRENLEMHAMLYGMPKEGRGKKIDGMLELVGLTARQKSRIKEYSGGMRKRLEIARGILHNPKILFLDEPTTGLDPQSRQHIWEHIAEMSKKYGTTIVFTTHYLEEAEQFAERVAIIDKGKIIATGTPKELISELGGDTLVMKCRDPKGTSAALRKMKFVNSVKLRGAQVSAVISGTNENLPRLLKTLSGIESIEIQPATLNGIFIKYTGKGIREQEGEGGWMERMMDPNNR